MNADTKPLLEKPSADLSVDELHEIYLHIEKMVEDGNAAPAMELYKRHCARFLGAEYRKKFTRKHKFFAPIPGWGLGMDAANMLRATFTHYMSGYYIGANLVSYLRSTYFLGDEKFAKALGGTEKKIEGDRYKSYNLGGTAWNKHFVAVTAYSCLNKPGVFVECGTYKASCADIITKFCDFGEGSKDFYLIDLFGHEEGDTHSMLPDHNSGLYEQIQEKFAHLPTVKVTKGRVPDIIPTLNIEQIAFMHIDMNDAIPEVLALEAMFDRVVPGGIILLDDYGHIGRQDQQVFINAFLKSKGYKALELPTGQGMIIK